MSVTDEMILDNVEKEIDTMRLGFSLSPEDKALLDQPHLANKHRILELEDKLPIDIKNELFRIANSPLYAKHRREEAADFWEVSSVLGLENIKAYIFCSSLFRASAGNKDVLELKNKALATAGLSMAIMHNILGYDIATMPKVQLCALVSEFGKIPFFIYRQNQHENQEISAIMTEEFINIHHGKIGLKMVERFSLPAFLNDLFTKETLIFFDREHGFATTTVVRIAKLLVRDSFKHYGKLILTSVLDDSSGVVWGSVGTELQTFFDALGIKHLVEIRPYETEAQTFARKKRDRSS